MLKAHFKRGMAAGLVRWRPLRTLLRLAVRLFAPQHRIGISVFLLDENQRVLLLKHVYHPELPWGPPGGWLDRGEAPHAGAARELWEETGLTAEIGPILLLEYQPHFSHVAIAYLAQLPPGRPIPPLHLSHEIMAAEWFTADNLPTLSNFTYRALHLALSTQNPSTPQPP
jgi:8-oxo-dGTP diphosphatase